MKKAVYISVTALMKHIETVLNEQSSIIYGR